MPLENFFQFLAARLNGPEVEGMELSIDITFDSRKDNSLVVLKNSVLNVFNGKQVSNPDISFRE